MASNKERKETAENIENIEKISRGSKNIVEENIEQLKKIFPSSVKEGLVDFEQLKTLLGESIGKEKELFGLNWKGKNESYEVLKQKTYKSLKIGENGFNAEESENLIITGDNLEVLKLLLNSYHNKVKMIYIDPPYNTGSDFVYEDDFKETEEEYFENSWQKDSEGVKSSTNMESGGRFHSKWLSMIAPRLNLARMLLKDDGVIFISIDDNEQASLKVLCDEIFGGENFITQISIEMSTTQGMKVASAQKGNIVKNCEYILCYSKEATHFNFSDILYSKRDWDVHYSIYWDRVTNSKMSLKQYLKSQGKNIENISEEYSKNKEFKNFIHRIANKIWQDAECNINMNFLTDIERDRLSKGEIIEYTKNKTYYLKATNTGKIRQLLSLDIAIGVTDDFTPTKGIRKIRGNLWLEFNKDMMNIGRNDRGISIKNGEKPIRLLMNILKISTQSGKNDIVLDFFAGSGTTAHSVLKMNQKDGGNRKFILVQIDEIINKKETAYKEGFKTIDEITCERVKRAIQQIQKDTAENPNLEFEKPEKEQDLGFKHLSLCPSFLPVEKHGTKIKAKDLDLFKPIPETADKNILIEILLSLGRLTDLAHFKKETIADHVFYHFSKTYICLERKNISKDLKNALIQKVPNIETLIFIEQGFSEDGVKLNLIKTLKTLQKNIKISVF